MTESNDGSDRLKPFRASPRPTPSAAASSAEIEVLQSEVATLRAERDALQARIAELEAQPEATPALADVTRGVENLTERMGRLAGGS